MNKKLFLIPLKILKWGGERGGIVYKIVSTSEKKILPVHRDVYKIQLDNRPTLHRIQSDCKSPSTLNNSVLYISKTSWLNIVVLLS